MVAAQRRFRVGLLNSGRRAGQEVIFGSSGSQQEANTTVRPQSRREKVAQEGAEQERGDPLPTEEEGGSARDSRRGARADGQEQEAVDQLQ